MITKAIFTLVALMLLMLPVQGTVPSQEQAFVSSSPGADREPIPLAFNVESLVRGDAYRVCTTDGCLISTIGDSTSRHRASDTLVNSGERVSVTVLAGGMLWFSLNQEGCPPRILSYDPRTRQLVDKAPEDAQMRSTVGIDSVGAIGNLVLFSGRGMLGGVNLFAFRSDDATFLGSTTLEPYVSLRGWLATDGVLYATVGNKHDGGSVLRWKGDVTSPFRFDVVGRLDSVGADMTVHEGRLFVATWPDGDSLAGLYMSPLLRQNGLTAASADRWTKVWQVDAYEPDPVTAATYRIGALASFDGYLFWATSHVPLLAAKEHLARYGLTNGAGGVEAAIAGTHRSTSVFRGRRFGARTEMSVLYGLTQLPVYDGSWRLVPNKMGRPYWGHSGLGDYFNHSVRAMTVYKGQLYLGTVGWRSYASGAVKDLVKSFSGSHLSSSFEFPNRSNDGHLFRMASAVSPAIPVTDAANGLDEVDGVETILSEEALYVGVVKADSAPTGLTTEPTELAWELQMMTTSGTQGRGRPESIESVVPTPSPVTPSMTPTPGMVTLARPTVTLSPGGLWPNEEAPMPVTKISKMGVGVYGWHAGDGVIYALRCVQPSVILLQDPDLNFVKRVRYLFPTAFLIGRTFLPEQPLDDPERRGIELADKIAEKARYYEGLFDAWQGYNEPVGHNDYAGYTAYNKLQVAFARRLQDHYGIAAIAGNDPPGAVEPVDYARYFGEAIQASRYFGLHAYAGPGALALKAPDAEYYALRYRLVHDELERAGIENVSMVLTEVGLGHGWRGKISEEAMANDFMWLADELEKDPYMKGMAIFGMFVGSDWREFDILGTRIVDLLGQYQPRRTGG